jgi:hypothetical protein
MKKRILTLVIVLSVVAPFTVYAHFLGYSSVDIGEIRWGGNTVYSTARDHAHTTWNSLRMIDIKPDTASTYEDVTYGDQWREDVTWAGRYVYWGSLTDNIDFNQYYLSGKNYTSDEKKHVALHEMGHALGLDHTWAPNVMVSGRYSITKLGPHDIEDYNSLWGN